MRLISWLLSPPHNTDEGNDDGHALERVQFGAWAVWVLMASVTAAVVWGAHLLMNHLSDTHPSDEGAGPMLVRGLIALAFVLTLRILRRWRMPL